MPRTIRFRFVRAAPGSSSRPMRVLGYLVFGAFLAGAMALSAAITFLVASRSADPVVPDLIGVGFDAAPGILQRAGLRLVEVGSRHHETVAPDRIAEQDPEPGAPFKRGRAVQVHRSLGPARSTVPRLEGDTLAEARRRLEASELVVGRISEVGSDFHAAGRVIAQSPAAYAEAPPHSPVSVLLSTGPKPEAYLMPDFIGRRYGDIADALSRAAVRVRGVRSVDYRGIPAGIIVAQEPPAGTRVTPADRILLSLSR